MPDFQLPAGQRLRQPSGLHSSNRFRRPDLRAAKATRDEDAARKTRVARGVGRVTDLVEKELSGSHSERGAQSGALRPEPTRGSSAYPEVAHLPQPEAHDGPARCSLDSPRRRYREFWQFDVEAIGDPGPAIDAELIELALRFYREVGLPDVEVRLNSIGDAACRPAYIEELTTFYRAHVDRLPPVERDRLERNVLRLLDSKDPAMVELNAGAPKITDHLCDACADHFAASRPHLEALGISSRLTRGSCEASLLHPERVRVLP